FGEGFLRSRFREVQAFHHRGHRERPRSDCPSGGSFLVNLTGYLGGLRSPAQASDRVDMNAEEQRFNLLVTGTDTAFGERVQPPVMFLGKKVAGVRAFLGVLRLG